MFGRLKKLGRKIGSSVKNVGRSIGGLWKRGRKVYDKVREMPVIGSAVQDLENRYGIDEALNIGDDVADTIS